MLIDTHCHINTKDFEDSLEEVLERAKDNDVKYMVVVGFDKETNKRAIELATTYDFLFATVGYHPTIAKDVTDDDFKRLEKQVKHERVVAVGECGLDYHWDKEHKEDQIRVFKKHIMLSNKYNKPLVIHMRDAQKATYDVLKDYENINGVMHCFTGSSEMALRFIDLGLYISLGGPVTFKNAKKPKEVAKEVPINRLLVETDSPYLSPHPYRGKQNEPFRVSLVAKEIASIHNISYNEIANQTTKNAITLFQLKEMI